MKTHKILLGKKFVLNPAIIGRSMFFSVFYLFGMALFLLVVGWAFQTPFLNNRII
ncbi:hypothetical protein HMPREF1434_01063 [Helicobacter pylori GAMchJs124i]|nr:hypothetical protein HMPREF1434_01063 [Helicobacter pylori GAMchJs124i]